MKSVTLTVLLMAGTLLCAAAENGGKADELIARETMFNRVFVQGDWQGLQEIEAEDVIFTNADGLVTHRADDVANLKSGDLKFDFIDMSDVKVQDFGVVAVTTGKLTEKARYKNIDLSGTYRFTDVWANRGGKWLLIVGQETVVAKKK